MKLVTLCKILFVASWIAYLVLTWNWILPLPMSVLLLLGVMAGCSAHIHRTCNRVVSMRGYKLVFGTLFITILMTILTLVISHTHGGIVWIAPFLPVILWFTGTVWVLDYEFYHSRPDPHMTKQ